MGNVWRYEQRFEERLDFEVEERWIMNPESIDLLFRRAVQFVTLSASVSFLECIKQPQKSFWAVSITQGRNFAESVQLGRGPWPRSSINSEWCDALASWVHVDHVDLPFAQVLGDSGWLMQFCLDDTILPCIPKPVWPQNSILEMTLTWLTRNPILEPSLTLSFPFNLAAKYVPIERLISSSHDQKELIIHGPINQTTHPIIPLHMSSLIIQS